MKLNAQKREAQNGTMPSSSSDGNRPSLSTTQVRKLSTLWDLPHGWENCGFHIRGNGMLIECPICNLMGLSWKPGIYVPPHRRRKVVMGHMMVDHPELVELIKSGKISVREPARLRRIK